MLPGLLVLSRGFFEDSRGYFFESYNERVFCRSRRQRPFCTGTTILFPRYGVIRGLHYQLNPWAPGQTGAELEGTILDVVVDIRKGSTSSEETFALEISAANKNNCTSTGLPWLFGIGERPWYCTNALFSIIKESSRNPSMTELGIDWKIPAKTNDYFRQDRVLPFFRIAQ